MNRITEKEIESILLKVFFGPLVLFLLCFTIVICVWQGRYDYLLRKEGIIVIATIIDKEPYEVQFDIEYEGKYYKSSTELRKSDYKKIQVGERFWAILLPDQLKYYYGGVTPSCFKLTLTRLPRDMQDIENEKVRIISMYSE